LDDPFFTEDVPDAIKSQKQNAEYVICTKLRMYEKHFESVDDEYLRERIYDIRGVCRRVIYHLLQNETQDQTSTSISLNNIIVARELTPADSIHFHHKTIKGLITEFGGRTSHAAILARSLEIPAIVGVKDLVKNLRSGLSAIIDGSGGVLIINPDKKTKELYKQKAEQFSRHKLELLNRMQQPIQNLPGKDIRMLVNLNELSEIEIAKKYKAAGVGLFRTELNFIAKERLLREQEQFLSYKQILSGFSNQEVTIRVLDLGGDKFLNFSDSHKETNPFLGWRSIRFLLSEPAVYKTQLHAILRASAYGKAKILLPMIASRDEIIESKKLLREVMEELDEAKIRYDKKVPIGIMIETPSAALIIDDLIREIDFVSIGTNDLIQFTLAVDRNNEKVASYYQPLSPAVISLMQTVISTCKRHKKPVSVCGEMAGDPHYTQLLLAMGVEDFSMQPVSIPQVNNVVLATREETLNKIEQRLKNFFTASELADFLDKNLKDTLA
jgi:phosphotransferase system enzyme I (PtsI)